MSCEWAGVQPSPGKQGSIMCHMGLGKKNAITLTLSFFYPLLYMLSMTMCCMEDSFSQFGVNCPSCVTSQLFLYPQPH